MTPDFDSFERTIRRLMADAPRRVTGPRGAPGYVPRYE